MRNIIKGPKITWIDIQNPNQEDIEFLKKNFKFHPLVLKELIPPGHRPKVERYKDYLFMILYYPVHSKDKRETRPRELDILVAKNVLITSRYKSMLPLKSLFDKCNLYPEIRKRYMNWSAGYLLFLLLNSIWKNSLIKLDRIDAKIEAIESEMFQGKEKEMVREISLIKTDIMNFWRIVEPQIETLEQLCREGTIFFGRRFYPYFSNIVGTCARAWNALKTFKETVLALEDTNQSLLSTKTNEVIQILTVFSVILMPLTLIASIWGMNVSLPFANSPLGFWIIMIMMLFFMGFFFFFFRKKKWL
ncbi:MAG: magnesium transporter CorA family protein [bacterium]